MRLCREAGEEGRGALGKEGEVDGILKVDRGHHTDPSQRAGRSREERAQNVVQMAAPRGRNVALVAMMAARFWCAIAASRRRSAEDENAQRTILKHAVQCPAPAFLRHAEQFVACFSGSSRSCGSSGRR